MWFLLQILSYGFVGWVAFLLLAYFVPRRMGLRGVFVAHLLLGIGVFYWDAAWVREQMSKPDWSETGTPDLDGVFVLGALARIFIINIAVTPIAILGVWHHKRARTPGPSAIRSTPG